MSRSAERTIAEWIRETAERLEATSESPRVDAEYLVAYCVRVERRHLLARQHESIALPALENLVERRLRHEPIAYILGEWEFYGVSLCVDPPALVPRPETELLFEEANFYLAAREMEHARILDLCTGTGCIALAFATTPMDFIITATDINPDTLRVARRNVRRHRKEEWVRLHEGDLFDALPKHTAPFEVIVSNPPYVSEAEYETLAPDIRDYEDPHALLAGPDGLAFYRRIIAEAPAWLAPGGFLGLEIGESQAEAVQALMKDAGFDGIEVKKDLAGHDRVVTGMKPPIIKPTVF